MKLSVWQQFSSNHSAAFTIIGQFANEVQARDAAKRLQKIWDDMLVHRRHRRGDAIKLKEISLFIL